MRRFGLALVLFGIAAGQSAWAADDWQRDRVVVVMRHGVRPPTKAEPLPKAMVPAPWPTWDVNWGELTLHGEKAVAILGTFDRARYAPLIGSGCPANGAVRAVADTDQRTVRTAEVYVAALFPGCAVVVEHLAQSAIDPRFSPFEGAPLLTGPEATAAAETALPAGGTAALDRRLADDWHLIDHILDCHDAACAIAARPTAITAPNGRVKLAGALGLGASFAETLALEYADGKPVDQVGWGRASRDDITRLLELHAWEFALTARPQPIARVAARKLLHEVFAALADETAPRFALFVGHDTNLALIGGVLGLHWHVSQFAADDPPPGGAIVFERWHNRQGRYRLTVQFRSQTLDEMRNLTQPGPAAVQALAFNACARAEGCTLGDLRAQLAR